MRKTFRAAALALGASALAGFAPGAQAAWTFSNDAAGDGSIVGSFPAGFTITGSDNGSGDNTSYYVQTFTTSEILTFTWQYASLDSGGTAYDTAGFVVDNVETQLSVNSPAYTPSSGTWTITVDAGDTFGFYVHSIDSLGGPGLLAVDEALPPPPPPAIPEPQAPALMLAGLGALFAAARARAIRRG